MFSSNKGNGTGSTPDTLISSKTEIAGDVKFTGVLRIEGVVKGNVLAEAGSGAELDIASSGRVEGQVSAPKIIINGEVVGDVHTDEHILLDAKARVRGDVYYKSMEMVLGAEVNGKLNHQGKGQGKGQGKKGPQPTPVPDPVVAPVVGKVD